MKYRYFIIGGLLAIPIILIALPADFFDKGQSLCVSQWLLDMECYACGMTRSIMHILHGEWAVAAGFNKLGFIVFPLLLVLWYQEIRRQRKLIRKEKGK